MLVIVENAWCEFIEVQRKSRLLLYLVLNGELLFILHYYNFFPFYLTLTLNRLPALQYVKLSCHLEILASDAKGFGVLLVSISIFRLRDCHSCQVLMSISMTYALLKTTGRAL